MFKDYLESSLTRLFTDINSCGFWDDKSEKIIESLFHDDKWNWEYKPSDNSRYSVFCLGMLLLSKEMYQLNTIQYDDKIKKFLLKIKSNEETFSSSDLTYGALLSLILGEKIYHMNLITHKTQEIISEKLILLRKSRDNNDFLLLIPAYFYSLLFPSEELTLNILKIQKRLLESLNQKCYFETGDLRASYHQRIMYALWGLIFTSSFGNSTTIKVLSKRIIGYFYNNRKLNDNAFVWHTPLYFAKYYGMKIPVYNKRSSGFLFECHQTFYVNSINFYQYSFKDDGAFLKEKQNAMEWISGGNRNSAKLVELTGIDLPCRLMTTDGNYFIEGEMYKGSYEVGSYILALSSF